VVGRPGQIMGVQLLVLEALVLGEMEERPQRLMVEMATPIQEVGY